MIDYIYNDVLCSPEFMTSSVVYTNLFITNVKIMLIYVHISVTPNHITNMSSGLYYETLHS